MNDEELWTIEKYDEAWAKLDQEALVEDWQEIERIEHGKFKSNYRLWRALITIWILASVGILLLTIIVKLFNAMRGG